MYRGDNAVDHFLKAIQEKDEIVKKPLVKHSIITLKLTPAQEKRVPRGHPFLHF